MNSQSAHPSTSARARARQTRLTRSVLVNVVDLSRVESGRVESWHGLSLLWSLDLRLLSYSTVRLLLLLLLLRSTEYYYAAFDTGASPLMGHPLISFLLP